MRLNPKMTVAAIIVLTVIIPPFVFCFRSPVLIVMEKSFIDLYGKKRMDKEAFLSSLALFRPIKKVAVANDAGDDVVPFAVAEVSIKPNCVLFPLRFAKAARLYREMSPNIPVVILEGRYLEDENPAENALGAEKSEYFVYKTDISDDFYRIGLAVSAIKPNLGKKEENSDLNEEIKGKIIVFIEQKLTKMKDIFLRGLYDRGELLETHFYNSFSQYYDMSELFCVVMAGAGYEFLDKKTGVPVVLYTWLNPSLLPFDAAMVVNDSPFAQARQAVKMVKSGEKTGLIKSEFLVLDKNKFNGKVIAIIKKNR